MNNKDYFDPSNSEDLPILQHFCNHSQSSDMFQELIKVQSDPDNNGYQIRNHMEIQDLQHDGKSQGNEKKGKGRSKQKKKTFYRQKIAQLGQPGDYATPEYKYTTSNQQDPNLRLSKEEQLKRNRESAKNSRQRKKEYVGQLIKVVEDQKRVIQELTEKLEHVTLQRDRLRNTHQDEVKNFQRSKAQAYQALEVTLQDQNSHPLQVKTIIQDMMNRFGTSGSQRMQMINFYMNEIIEVLISDIHKYFLTSSVFSQNYTSPNQKQSSIDHQVMRILGLDPSKLHSMMGKFKDRFIKEANVFKDLTQELYRIFKSIGSKGKAIDMVFGDMMKEFDPKALGQLIHWFQEYRFMPDVKRVRTQWTKLLKTGEQDFQAVRKQMKKE